MADADLSYPFMEMPLLIAQMSSGADFVLGNRLNNIQPGAMPFLNRRLGTPVLSWCIRRLHSLPTFDCNSGMRVFRKDHVMAMNLRSRGMEIASEMSVRAGQMGLTYREVTIPFYPDQRGRPSHLHRWRDGWRHLRLIAKMKRTESSTHVH